MTVMTVLFLCLAMGLSVLFSGAEIALGPLSRESLERLSESGTPGAAILVRMSRNKRRFLLFLTAGRLGSAIFGTMLLEFAMVTLREPMALQHDIATGVLTAVAAAIIFLLTDSFLGRIVATRDPETMVPQFALLLFPFHLVLAPAAAMIDIALGVIVKKTVEQEVQEEAFKELIKSQSESGVIQEDEEEMIQSIVTFADTTVREVMIPRIDVVAAESDTSVDDLIDLFRTHGHSRIPLYSGTIDNIVGIAYAKDLLIAISLQGKEAIHLESLVRRPYFVPEHKSVSLLLEEFKRAKVHLAVVVDEYGGTAGIVALEDILEEIVGEIQDEYDAEEDNGYRWLTDSSLVMDAGLDIDDVNDIIGSDIPNDEYDTLAGFLYHQLGIIPQGGETVTWENYTFTVKSITGHRISTVLVDLHDPGEHT